MEQEHAPPRSRPVIPRRTAAIDAFPSVTAIPEESLISATLPRNGETKE